MKKTVKLLFLLLFSSISLTFAQHADPSDILINIRKNNVTVSEILREIEVQSGYYFVFSKEDLDTRTKVSLQAKNEKLDAVLKKLLSPLNITYVFSGDNIALKQSSPTKETTSNNEEIPLDTITKKITGIVTDSNGDPIIGAVIFEKGSKTNASVTGADGRFTLSLHPTGSVRIHCLGFFDKIISVWGKTFLSVRLEEDVKMIEEVIVVGYGTQKRMNVTGAISVISGEKLIQSQRPDLSNALAGNLPGVRTIQKSGRPGADGSTIDIRGYDPDHILTIVDGVERPFSQIDPNEIESISVLKDAAAAVYGTQGANGVILVTTKTGSGLKSRINYNFNYAMQSITRYPKYMNVTDYMNYYNEARLNLSHLGQVAQFSPDDIANAVNTDWQKEVLKESAPMQQHNVNVSGGTKETKYFFSLGYLNQDGILKTKDNFQRFNFRSNASALIVNGLTAGMQIGGRREKRDAPSTIYGGGSEDNFSQGIFKNLAMALPYKSIYANNNQLYYNDLGSEPNPVALLDRNLVGTDLKQYEELNGQFSLNYDVPFFKGLSLKALLAYDRQIETQDIFKKASAEYEYYPLEDRYDKRPLNQTTSKSETTEQNNILNQQYSINYKKLFGKHDVSGLLLLETRQFSHRENLAAAEFGISSVPELGAAGAVNKNVDGSSYETAVMGIVGRINYLFDNKYLVEFSFREDGVSKFLKNDRWVFTSGVSAGWRISEENFIKNLTGKIDNLKLRASYAIFPLANQLNETYFLSGYNYPGRDVFGAPIYFVQGENNLVLAAANRGIINPYLTWEEVGIADIGIDAALWHGRLYGEFDWFYREHTGIYAKKNKTIATSFGAEMPDENLNSDSNRGIEIIVGTRHKIADLFFDIKGMFTYTRQKREYVESATPGNQYLNWRNNGNNRWQNVGWGYEATGQFQTYEEILHSPIQDNKGNTTLLPGDIRYKDINDDGRINDLDIIPIGRNDRPEIFFGLNVSVKWKNFDFTLFLQGATHYTYNFNYKDPFIQGGIGNAYQMFEDHWRRADVNDPYSEWIPGRFPALRVEGYGGNRAISTFWTKNATYLRLKTIDLGYTIPESVTQKAGIQRLRFYVNAYNLLTFAAKDLKYVDPEGETGYGLYYPQMKTVNFGLNLEF